MTDRVGVLNICSCRRGSDGTRIIKNDPGAAVRATPGPEEA